jgi:hypothetical protein
LVRRQRQLGGASGSRFLVVIFQRAAAGAFANGHSAVLTAGLNQGYRTGWRFNQFA